ncbi:MAG TPA: hypothetical protein VN253_10115 [Kofleriaceae bacterium]|nr:hypothetical protein [Kofleriaceae bacterium]
MGARSGIIVLACVALAGCKFSAPGGEGAGADAPGADAPGADARPIEAADCPADYQPIVGLTSRYRLTGAGHYRQTHDDCKDDLVGKTHLVVLDTPQESDQLRSSYNQDWWAGAVQARSQATPDAGWFQITGGALAAGLWATGQPNDISGVENNDQNVGLRRSGGLEDEPGTAGRPGLCECDGLPVAALVEGYIPDTSGD